MYEENDRDIQKNSKTVRIGLTKGNVYKKSRKLERV